MTSAISIDDVRGQLLEECRNGAVVRYAYDAVGNRIRKTEDEKETRYHYNQKKQLLQKEDADGISCFTYDRQGGIIEEKTAAGNRRFTYNSLHQQTQVETETGNIQKNRYDAVGLRYELIENGRQTSFVYHNGELLHEKGEEAGLFQKETSYHLGAGIEAFQRNRKTFYYHQDEQLNTTLISDEKAASRNHYQYDAFGAGLEAAEALPNRIRYTGQQYDEQTGQYYLRARYYNPVLGRFMQEDVYQGDGLNLYAYCHNNSVVYYDPSGYAKKNTNSSCGNSGQINNTGIVEFSAPPNATKAEIAQVKAYIRGCNKALKAGKLSSTGRVSTKGSLRSKATQSAKKEKNRARKAGTPYKGHPGHVPDTTWTGDPNPYSWLDLDPRVNTSLGSQAKNYPVGYKPTKFVYKP